MHGIFGDNVMDIVIVVVKLFMFLPHGTKRNGRETRPEDPYGIEIDDIGRVPDRYS